MIHGSDWPYLRLYSSPETEEDCSAGPLAGFLEQAVPAGSPSELPGNLKGGLS
jgi:hypothetical protein